MLKKSIKIKATNIKQTTTPTQGTLRYCISAAHSSPIILLSIDSSDAKEADSLGRIECSVLVGSVQQARSQRGKDSQSEPLWKGAGQLSLTADKLGTRPA